MKALQVYSTWTAFYLQYQHFHPSSYASWIPCNTILKTNCKHKQHPIRPQFVITRHSTNNINNVESVNEIDKDDDATLLSSTTTNDDDDNNDDHFDTMKELRTALHTMYSTRNRQPNNMKQKNHNSFSSYSYNHNNMENLLSELEQFATTTSNMTSNRTLWNASMAMIIDNIDEYNNDENAILLDSDAYMNMGNNQMIDDTNMIELGQRSITSTLPNYMNHKYRESMQNIAQESFMMSVPNHDVSVNSVKDDRVLQKVLQLWDHFTTVSLLTNRTMESSKYMHQKIFQEEDGYLQQSDIFRKSLLDNTLIMDAMMERRSKRYKQRQEVYITELEQQILEMELSLFNETTMTNTTQSLEKKEKEKRSHDVD
jgi:hypothetical protein